MFHHSTSNYFRFLFVLGLAFAFTACTPKASATMGANDDDVDWSAKARAYKKDPASLKAFTEACEANEQEVLRLRTQVNRLESNQSANSNQYANTRAEMEALRSQLNEAQQQLTVAQNALANRDEVITDQNIANGIIFRVQLGAFAQPTNQLNNDMATGDALELNDQNGLQKVVVSQFRTYENARILRDRLRQMGVNGAFVVALNNGERIEVQEALQLSGQE